MFKRSKYLLSSMGLASVLYAVALPGAAANLPAVQHYAGNTFITGGIGLDESTAMRGEMKNWPLAMLFAQKQGQGAEYVADVHVVLTDHKGHAAIDAVSQGPFMLASVQPGTYQLAATLGNKTLHQTVNVKKDKSAKVSFIWPVGTGAMH